jgi:putative membrane protein
MRVVQFFQVVVLLLLLAYSVLVYLENPVLLRLPLLFAGRELVLPAGLALGLGLLAGALYATLLILPRSLRQRMMRRADLLRRRDAETRLQATLQAVIDGADMADSVGPDRNQPELTNITETAPALPAIQSGEVRA